MSDLTAARYPHQPAAVPAEEPLDTVAVLGFVFSFIWGLLGLVLSIVALSHTKAGSGRRGRKLAQWGLGLSIASIVFQLILMAVAIPVYVNAHQQAMGR